MRETNFFWDPLSDNILQERDEIGAVTAEYTTEPGLYGNLISQDRQGAKSQYHFDALGSTLALINDNQQVTDTYAYAAFGNVTESITSAINPFQCVGKNGYYADDLTGEYVVRARALSPLRGAWLSKDPLGVGGSSENLFRYVGGRPTLTVDASGLMVYGNYCGQASFPLPPKDAVDTCCLLHDKCYGVCGVSGPWGVIGPNPCARCCDKALCACLLTAPCFWWPMSDVGCESFRLWASALCCQNALRML